jgi:hypothetical protein
MVAFQSEIIPFCDPAVCDLDHTKITAPDVTRLRLFSETGQPWPAYLGVVA